MKYLEELKEIVQKHVPNLVEIKENPSEEEDNDIYSAKGLYTNILSFGNLIYMPAYEDKDNDNFNKNLLSKYGKVIPINCDQLAAFGGLLHCISFTN